MTYPSTKVRVENAERAAREFGVTFPSGFAQSFIDSPPTTDDRMKFLLALADSALESLIPSLLNEVNTIAQASQIDVPSVGKIQEIYDCFALLVPSSHAGSLANILNAGWRASLDDSFWKDMPHVQLRKREILNEIVLKSIEVFEIEQILGHAS